MRKSARLVVFSLCYILSAQAQAQIVFRGASSAAEVGAITYRSATTGVSGGIAYRGAATTGTTSLAPVYRGSTSSSAATGVLTLTISRPATTVENDVMVAAIGVSANTPTITAPAGWTLVRQMNNTAANPNSLAIYTKVATAAEPFSYSWTLSASAGAVGGIQTFYNVDISNPVVAENGQTTASSLTHTAPVITTTVANTMLVGHYTFSSAATWAAQNPPGPPVTMTESYDIASLAVPNASGQSLQGARTVQAAAGLSAAYASRASANTDVGNAHILALRPALRVPRFAASAPSDFMIAAIGVQPSTATLTPPAGWTLVSRINNAGPTSNSLVIYRKFAVAGEPASYLWQLSGATSVVGGIQSYVGVDPATPIDVQSGAATPSSLTHTAPAITTTVANAILVGHYTFASSRTWAPQNPPGPPAAMAESYDVRSQGLNAAGQSLEGTWQLQAAAGGSAAFASTASANADAGATHMMALRPAGTQISIATPVGTTTNDVLIAAIGLTPSSVTITPPAGWVSIRRSNNAGGVSNALEIFYKVASSTEPAGHTWTFSGNASAVGGIQSYLGVDTLTPIDAENGTTTASSLNHAAPTITTTVPNTMLVGHYTFSSSATWAPQNPAGPPVAMTESYDRLFPPAGATGQALEGTRQLQAAAGLSTAFTSRASANADFGNTHLLALRPQAGSSIELPLPLGTAENDVMIAAIGYQPNTLTITPPAGWTLVGGSSNAGATANSLAVFRRIAGPAEPASYLWTFSGGAQAAGGMQVFSGADTTTPIDVSAGQATASNLNHATPSITTTVANTMLVAAHTFASSATWIPPAGMTEAYDRANLNTNNAAGQSIEGSYAAQAAIGATGAKTARASANADRGNTYLLALRPAPAFVQPAGFNGCESATCIPMAAPLTYAALYTKLAGTAFPLQGVALTALGALEPTFNGIVTVDLLANINTGVALGANNCPVSQDATIALGNATFVSGRAAINGITVTNAYRDVRMRFTCAAAVCGSLITRCSTDNFAVRPDSLAVSTPTIFPLRAGTVALGDTFTLSAVASGNASTTTSYNGTPQINNTLLAAASSGPNIAGNLDGTFTAAVGGTASGTFGYSEVGYFNFATNGVFDNTFTSVDQPGDCTGNFSNTPVAGQFGCNFGNTVVTTNIGRFTPANFVLLNDAMPVPPVPSVTPFCGGGATAFTYAGQPSLRLRFTLEAQNMAGGRTQNYDSTYANGNGLVDTLAENNNDNNNLGGRLDHTAAPWPVWTAGQFIVDKSGTFSRLAAADGPYNLLEIGVRVTRASAADGDNDGIRVSPQNITVAGRNGVLLPGPTRVRHGRARLFNAYGSELLNLPVAFLAEFWNGTGWTVNALDTCTGDTTLPLAAANAVSVNLATIAPAAWATCVQDSGNPGLSASGCAAAAPAVQRYREGATPGIGFTGNFNLNLRAPGVNNTGAVTVTGNVPAWLQFPWTGGLDANPTARATFGINNRGNVFIYQRENY